MKYLSVFFLTLMAGIPAARAITVTTPVDNAQVSPTFNLIASTDKCSGKPAVSMGYSIDYGTTTIVGTSFSARVSAGSGNHILHVKCWGAGVHQSVALNIKVAGQSAQTPRFSPASGIYDCAQTVTFNVSTPGAVIYYTTDGSAPTASSLRYTGPITVSRSKVVEAVAMASGYANSGLARADYTIKPKTTGPVIPDSAIAVNNIERLGNWKYNHDPATPGTSTGESSLVDSPSISGSARVFSSEFTHAGGEIYHITYAHDTVAKNFVYDAWVWIEAGSVISNLEMDSNQVTADGDTVIFGFQCDGYSHTWDYGGPWIHSKQPCDVNKWSSNAWHHIQISYSRDDKGIVSYHSVWLDGTEQPINGSQPSARPLHWAKGVVNTQFQIDGRGASGASVVYLDNLTIYRW